MSTLTAFQQEIDDFLEEQKYDPKYWQPHELVAHMVEEMGEISRIINREYGPKPPKENETLAQLEEEMGDLLVALICLANREGLKLEDGLRSTIQKMKTRDLDRFPRKK